MQTSTEKVTYKSHITVDGSRDGMILLFWFVSQNTNKFKTVPDGRLECIFMLTARMKNISLDSFTEAVYAKMIPFIDLIADKSKVFIEECVYDTNEHLDAHWMNIEKGSISSE